MSDVNKELLEALDVWIKRWEWGDYDNDMVLGILKRCQQAIAKAENHIPDVGKMVEPKQVSVEELKQIISCFMPMKDFKTDYNNRLRIKAGAAAETIHDLIYGDK